MKKNAWRIALNIANYILGSVFNIAVFALTVLLAVTFATRGFNFGKDFVNGELTEGGAYEEVVVEIPDDADTKEIAEILKENGLILNELLFMLQSKLNGTDVLFKGGTYNLNTGMTENEIMDALQSTKYIQAAPDEIVTIPEGLTLKQIGQILESKGFFTLEEFLEECENLENYDYYFLKDIPDRPNKLQGYLFPDTYYLPENPTPEQVIRKMLNRFDEIFTYTYVQRAEQLGMTMDEVIAAASIIEKEIRVPGEREFASAVIHNRLQANIPLEMCSTVLYALDRSRDRLLISDLQVDSPYNTYIYPGLPLGPIASPGAASIEAALYPAANCDYLYFVLKDPEVGEHFFTNNYDLFLRAKAQYNDLF